jgi:hypothetical protein
MIAPSTTRPGANRAPIARTVSGDTAFAST